MEGVRCCDGPKVCAYVDVGYYAPMSVRMRLVWLYPAILLASWLAVRTLAASPQRGLDDPPAPLASAGPASPELRDPALERFIGRLAAVARSRSW